MKGEPHEGWQPEQDPGELLAQLEEGAEGEMPQ
jgi:hypothetical protein